VKNIQISAVSDVHGHYSRSKSSSMKSCKKGPGTS